MYQVTLITHPECPDEDGTHERALSFIRELSMPFLPSVRFRFRWPEHGVTDEGEPIAFEILSTTWEVGTNKFGCHVAWWGGETWPSYDAAVAAYTKLGFKELT